MLKHPELRELTKKTVLLKKQSINEWAFIKFEEGKGCAFLDENKLCGVYKLAGEDFMSDTCKQYPRQHKDLNLVRYRSLTMSCPEVVRIVLFESGVFNFEHSMEQGKLSENSKAKFLPLWVSKINAYAVNLLVDNRLNLEQALLAIGVLTTRADLALKNQATESQIDDLYNELQTLIDNSLLAEHFANLTPVNQLQQDVLNSVQILFNKHSVKSRERMKIIHNALFKVSGGDSINIELINKAWEVHSKDLLDKHPDLLKRYVLYYLYHTYFPLMDNLLPSEAFNILVMNYFIIRCYLAAIGEVNNGLSEENIVLCFQAFQSSQMHIRRFSSEFKTLMTEKGITDVQSIISMLKI